MTATVSLLGNETLLIDQDGAICRVAITDLLAAASPLVGLLTGKIGAADFLVVVDAAGTPSLVSARLYAPPVPAAMTFSSSVNPAIFVAVL